MPRWLAALSSAALAGVVSLAAAQPAAAPKPWRVVDSFEVGNAVYVRALAVEAADIMEQHRITMWFSVPSAASLLIKRGALRPGSMPTLRWSLFCGEGLPRSTAGSAASAVSANAARAVAICPRTKASGPPSVRLAA